MVLAWMVAVGVIEVQRVARVGASFQHPKGLLHVAVTSWATVRWVGPMVEAATGMLAMRTNDPKSMWTERQPSFLNL